MNAATVLIEDDDVDMLEPVEVSDDNIDTGQKQNLSKSVDTIILDEDSSPAPTNHEAVTVNENDSSPVSTNDEVVTVDGKDSSPVDPNHEVVTVNDKKTSPAAINNEIVTDNDKNSSFARLLKNSTLLNKIVKRCLTMANNAGMSRVINKTLLPLYADADNKFKESEQFSDLLNRILSNLKHDPDHKFLHIKSLCEELKAGKFRRKVPFITLSKSLEKTNHYVPGRELFTKYNLRKKTMKSKNRNDKTAIINLDNYNSKKKRRKIGNVNEKTAIINLDNSDDECVIDLDIDDDSDAVIVTNIDDGHDTIVASDDKDDHEAIAADSDPDKIAASENEDVEVDIVADNNKNDYIVTNKNGDDADDNNDDVMVVDDNSDVVSNLSNKENNTVENENDETPTSSIDKATVTFDCKVLCNNINNKTNTYISENNNKIRNVTNSELFTSNNKNETANTSSSELLIPKKSVKSDRHSLELSRAIAIEKQIAICKEKIAQLEQEEVTNNHVCSPYILCDKYKAKIVQLYKRLCKLTGHGDVSLMKQRVVRLQVIDGHPPGPTRRLEQFLNSTIDETGTVPLPDFQDVVKCVSEADEADGLGWKKEQIMREAIVLFTQCGHALRKSRQRREYKDLIHLVREVKQDDPDDYDPANDDPLLRAKLEENKLIAKAKEDEIFERFAQMERFPNGSNVVIPRVCNILRINPADDSDTDSELDLAPPNISGISAIQHNHNANDDISNEIPGANSRPIERSSSLLINNQHEERLMLNQPAMRTTLDNLVNISTIQCAIDKIVQNAVSVMSNNAKVTSSQTILSIKKGNETITLAPKPTNITTEYPINTITQNELNITNTRTPFPTPNPIDTHIQNSINTTAQYATNSPVNITTQNKTITLTPNLANTTTQNLLYTTTQSLLYPPLYNQTNTNTSQHTPVNVVTRDKTITVTSHFHNRIIQNPLYITTDNTLNTINYTTESATSSPNNIKKPERDTPTHLMWSNTLQKVGSSNRYVVSFDSSTTQNNMKEIQDDHNIIVADSNITHSENVTEKTEEGSIKEELIDSNTYDVAFGSSTSQDNAKEKDHNLTEADVNTINSENVKVEIEEDSFKNEPIDSSTYCITFDSSASGEDAIDDHNITEADPNSQDSENVIVKTEEDCVKNEPIDISAMLSALGDNYLTTIFDIEDPFLVIEISSESSSDDES